MSEAKRCTQCGEEKPLDLFHVNRRGLDGRCSKCKACRNENNRRYLREPGKIERIEEWQRAHPERRRAAERRWYEREFPKIRAQRRVQAAILRGRLTRQPCSVCGSEPAQAHHDDYGKPLDVRWLCAKCHREHHVRERVARDYRKERAT